MPWLTIIMFFLSYFAAKSNGASDTQALVGAGLAAGSTYYVTHETEWGKTNLGQYDGVLSPGTAPILDKDGNPVLNPDGSVMTKVVDGVKDVLKDWGPTGTAAVLATGAAAAGGLFSNPLLLVGGAVVLLLLASSGGRSRQ